MWLITLPEVGVMVVVGAIGGLIRGIIIYLTGAARLVENWAAKMVVKRVNINSFLI
ncbi:hypothetical protein [Methanobacterium sp.]|uniref:hypothetical protein n=1 Tax=Methanobacterium sp. TaxID=2164 RepID=UPI003158D226